MWLSLPLALVAPARAADWYVPGDFPDVAAAYASPAVYPGDTLILGYGDHTVLPSLAAKRLTLRGQAQGSTTLRYSGESPGLTITADTTFEDLTLSGDGAVQLLAVQAGARLTLTRATIQEGNALLPPYEQGGCLRVEAGAAAIGDNATFQDCLADEGGAVFVESGSFDCSFCTFAANSASGASGGALLADLSSEVTLDAGLSTGNVAQGSGGAISLRGASSLDVRGTFFVGGSATDGGTIACNDAAFGCTISLSDATFDTSTAHGRGGHVFLGENGVLTILGSAFSNGGADEDGGSIYSAGNVYISDTLFSLNRSQGAGGAIYTSAAPVVLTRIRACENESNGPGGALALHADGGASATVRNPVLLDNRSDVSGGAIYLQGEGQVVHPTLSGNRAPLGAAMLAEGLGPVGVSEGVAIGQGEGVAFGFSRLAYAVSDTAFYGNAYGDLDSGVVGSSSLSLSGSPFGLLDPSVCPLPIPAFQGEIFDIGSAIDRDPDGSIADLGATGGPWADLTLWIDADGDSVPVMWDCDDTDARRSPLLVEVADQLDNDCDELVDEDIATGTITDTDTGTPTGGTTFTDTGAPTDGTTTDSTTADGTTTDSTTADGTTADGTTADEDLGQFALRGGSGCGCDAAPGLPGAGWLAALGLVCSRRRR